MIKENVRVNVEDEKNCREKSIWICLNSCKFNPIQPADRSDYLFRYE